MKIKLLLGSTILAVCLGMGYLPNLHAQGASTGRALGSNSRAGGAAAGRHDLADYWQAPLNNPLVDSGILFVFANDTLNQLPRTIIGGAMNAALTLRSLDIEGLPRKYFLSLDLSGLTNAWAESPNPRTIANTVLWFTRHRFQRLGHAEKRFLGNLNKAFRTSWSLLYIRNIELFHGDLHAEFEYYDSVSHTSEETQRPMLTSNCAATFDVGSQIDEYDLLTVLHRLLPNTNHPPVLQLRPFENVQVFVERNAVVRDPMQALAIDARDSYDLDDPKGERLKILWRLVDWQGQPLRFPRNRPVPAFLPETQQSNSAQVFQFDSDGRYGVQIQADDGAKLSPDTVVWIKVTERKHLHAKPIPEGFLHRRGQANLSRGRDATLLLDGCVRLEIADLNRGRGDTSLPVRLSSRQLSPNPVVEQSYPFCEDAAQVPFRADARPGNETIRVQVGEYVDTTSLRLDVGFYSPISFVIQREVLSKNSDGSALGLRVQYSDDFFLESVVSICDPIVHSPPRFCASAYFRAYSPQRLSFDVSANARLMGADDGQEFWRFGGGFLVRTGLGWLNLNAGMEFYLPDGKLQTVEKFGASVDLDVPWH
jgi:hypothetical protein